MAVAASLLVLSVSSVVVNAVTPFGPNVRVSAEPTLATERKPAAAADAFGNVYVVWAQNRNGDPDLYFGKSADGGITWSAPTRIGGNPPSGSTQDRPSVALGPNGEIVVAWQDDRLTYFDFDIYASISFDAGGTFTTPTKVSDGPAGILQLAPALAVNNRGHVAVAWQDYRTGSGAIRLSTATVGTFGFGPSVRVDDDPGPWTAAAPSVAETATGTIYVAYHDNRSGSADVYLARSLDGGSSFGASVRVDDTGAAGSAQGLISIAVDGLGRIYATWEDSRAGEVETDGRPIFDIYFALSTDAGASFSRNVRVDDGPRKSSQEAPRIAVGAAGTVYVVWDDARNTDWDPYFSYSTNAGATFAPSIRVDDAGDSTTDPPLQYDPQVVESRTGLVFAVWEDNRGPTGDIYGATAYLAVGSGLHVRIDLDAEMAWPGDAVGLTVRVTSNGTAVDGVSIGLASSTSGAFGAVQRTGPGVYHSSFTSSPSTPDGTDIVLTATAQKSGYVTGASQALLHVRKVILAAVEPTWDLLAVGQTMQVRASATAHGTPLPDAAAQSGAGGAGTIDPGSGITDAQGLWSTWFTPASGAGGSDATITLAVSKDGYLPATAQVAVPILAQPRPVDVLLTSGTREMMSRERANLRVELTSGGVGVTGDSVALLRSWRDLLRGHGNRRRCLPVLVGRARRSVDHVGFHRCAHPARGIQRRERQTRRARRPEHVEPDGPDAAVRRRILGVSHGPGRALGRRDGLCVHDAGIHGVRGFDHGSRRRRPRVRHRSGRRTEWQVHVCVHRGVRDVEYGNIPAHRREQARVCDGQHPGRTPSPPVT